MLTKNDQTENGQYSFVKFENGHQPLLPVNVLLLRVNIEKVLGVVYLVCVVFLVVLGPNRNNFFKFFILLSSKS